MIWRHVRIALPILASSLLLDAAGYVHALDVVIKVIVTREGMPWVLGTTNLPDGSILLVSLSRHEAKYSAKHTAVVSNRRYLLQDRFPNTAARFHPEITKLK